MEESQIAEYCKSDPNGQGAEREFSVNFTKEDKMAYIHTTIASQSKRLLRHSDTIVDRLSVYNTNTDTYSTTTVEDFNGDPNIVWGISGRVPIESIKIQGSPRSNRSYADIISPQGEVNFDGN